MRHSQAEIRKLVQEQKAPGKWVREFCMTRGRNREVFYLWRQRAKKEGVGFARVEASGAQKFELELLGGRVSTGHTRGA